MDTTVALALLLLCLPVVTIWALAKAAALRGPMPPAKETHHHIANLTTERFPYDERRDRRHEE